MSQRLASRQGRRPLRKSPPQIPTGDRLRNRTQDSELRFRICGRQTDPNGRIKPFTPKPAAPTAKSNPPHDIGVEPHVSHLAPTTPPKKQVAPPVSRWRHSMGSLHVQRYLRRATRPALRSSAGTNFAASGVPSPVIGAVSQLIAGVRRMIRDIPDCVAAATAVCRAHDHADPGRPRIVWNDEAARADPVDGLVTDAVRLLAELSEQELGEAAATRWAAACQIKPSAGRAWLAHWRLAGASLLRGSSHCLSTLQVRRNEDHRSARRVGPPHRRALRAASSPAR